MLTIGKLGASAGQLDYYERQVAAGAEDYYAGRGESPGTWMGRGLDALSVDLTFSAPKSVSVLYAVAGGEMSAELSEAHERAVAAAVSYLEREACLTRRGHAGGERVPGEGFVAAAYRHRLSRVGDPQLHTHVVAANLTRADGRFTSLDAHALYEHKSAAGAVYRAVLRTEVCDRLPWVQWRQAGRGLFEIDGVPEDVLRHFSQRRAEIEERAVELVGAGAARSLSREQMQGIALATRRPKARSRLGGVQWREAARARSGEHGFGPDELWTFFNRPEPDRPRPSLLGAIRRLSGPEGLTGHHNTFARRHAVAEIAGEFTDGIALDALERATDHYLADPSVCELRITDSGEQRFTTKDLLACERSILDGAARRYDSMTGVIASRLVDVALREAQPTLNADQAAAVCAIATSGNGVDTIQALAGTGKTTMMRTLADAYRRTGYEVYGTAPTARAARELRDVAGVPACTVHALARQLDGRLRADTVLLLDEAGMAGTRISAEILGHAERAGVKVVAVGDSGQLTSVQAGGWFAVLTEMQSGPDLRQVLRQRESAEREALAALHDGNADADVAMIARDNVTRDQLNQAARARLQTRGELSGEMFLTEGREWRVGDRIITRRNDRRLDVDNGTLATITRYDRRNMAVQIQTDSGEHRRLDLHYLAHHVERAYAITGHSSQGATVDHALVVGRPEEFTREWAYTVLSRARAQTSIHVMADVRAGEQARAEYAPTGMGREPHECLQALRHALGRSDARRTAAELTSSQTSPVLGAWFAQRLRREDVSDRARRSHVSLGR
jgi:conjugative relaxase-like TrwC/TraI family protein